MDNNFAKNLKALREAKSLTLKDVGNLIGVTKQTVSNYEKGLSNPDSYVLSQLAKVFSCSVDSLLFDNMSSLNLDSIKNILNKSYEHKTYEYEPLYLLKTLENKRSKIQKTISDYQNDLLKIDNIIKDFKNKYNLEISNEFLDFYRKNNIKVFNVEKDNNSNNTYDIPNIAPISAGYPSFTFNDIDKYFKIPKKYLSLGKDNYFILKVDGDSMDKIYKNGDYILVQKTSHVDNYTPSVVSIEDDYATFKIFSKDENYIYLNPCSTNPKHQKQTYPLNEYNYRILGKVLGVINEYE